MAEGRTNASHRNKRRAHETGGGVVEVGERHEVNGQHEREERT